MNTCSGVPPHLTVVVDAHQGKHKGANTSAEAPARVEVILRALVRLGFKCFENTTPLTRTEHLDKLNCSFCTMPLEGERCFTCGSPKTHMWSYCRDKDGDTTYMTPYTNEIVQRASEMVKAAVVSGVKGFTFVLTRPPGHHACSGKRMGFCHHNFAIDVLDSARALGKTAVILDIDAHHGDGTEEELLKRSYGSYISLHGFGKHIYPGTGATSSERILNIPLPAETTDADWLSAYDVQANPWILGVAPDMIILSAGFDAHAEDIIAPLRLSTYAYTGLSQRLKSLGIPVLAVLEGGYHIPVLADCAVALVSAFL
jgi:acetoin utilization deacetylase AcuC-like enzyme